MASFTFRRSNLSELWGHKSSTSHASTTSTLHSPTGRRARSHSIHQAELSGIGHEDAVLAEFKKMIQDAGLHLSPELIVNGDLDATLRRFLRARKYRLEAAFQMLEKSLAWRKRVGADDALRTPLPRDLVTLIRECRPSSYIGFHREGYPIFVERLGMLDGPRIEKEHLKEETLLTYHLREMEFMAQVVFVEASRRSGRTIDRVMSIMDASGLTFGMLTGFAQRLFRALTAMDSDNYPETCHNIFIVNNSSAFSAIWRVVKVFVDVGTREKIKVLGSGNPMLSALLQEFDASQIPSFLGGALDYDERRRQWLEMMDIAMAEAAARGKQKQQQEPEGAAVPAASSRAPLAINGFEHLPAVRTSIPASQASDLEDGDGFHTPASAASRASSALSVYFDAIEASGPSISRTGPSSTSSGGGSISGGSPVANPSSRVVNTGSFDAQLPHFSPHHQHHVWHEESKLAVVPSGDLSSPRLQPKCCVIS